uniref:Uncharacterized protein n=1 Tax=Panagrolaimus sp. ES5 TaxID=591445 RepID=A0AC34FE41_9BILA
MLRNKTDSSAINTNIPFNKLKEDSDKENLNDRKDSMKNVNISIAVKTTPPYTLHVNMGWIAGAIYMFFVCIYSTNMLPKQYIESCNGTDILPADSYKLLKEDVVYAQKEIKGINFTIRHGLSDEDPIMLNKKLEKYVAKLNDLNSTLSEQKEKRFQCYQENIEKYTAENPDYFFMIATTLYILINIFSFCYMVKFYKAAKSFYPEPSKAGEIPYSGYMNLGWIVGTIYIFIVIIHLIVNDNFPQNYLEFCNDKDIMAIDEYKMLKKDIAYIEEVNIE